MDILKRKNKDLDTSISLADKLSILHQQEQEIKAEKDILIEKSLRSPTSPKDVVLATKILNEKNKGEIKSYILDPVNSNDLGGYRSRPFGDVSYSTLRAMAKQTGIVSAIINTRKEQVASYADYSIDEFQPGWNIVKNIVNYFDDEEEFEKQKKLTSEDKKEIIGIINFIENCGLKDRMYCNNDNFNTFLRKFVEDSLTFDQACFEIVPSEFGTPYEFLMIDGATIRFCDSQIEKNSENIRGFYPFACQIYQNSIYTTYYPWELCMGIRNPTTNFLYSNYGISELEILIKIITYMLFAEGYTGKFFSQGSNPKGVFLAKGNLSEDKLAEFRQAWTAQVSGVNNSHKIPILSGTELEWVDWYKSNQDMEFSNWLNYLARLICSVFKIDPHEIGYSIDSDGANVNYESSIQEKIIYSKEKGLIPLLKFIEDKINNYLVFPLSNKKYKFKFTGIDNTQNLIEENDLKKVEKGVMSFQEYRIKHGLPAEIKDNDFLLNSVWIQYKQMQGQGQQQGGEGGFQGLLQQQSNENDNKDDKSSVFSNFLDDNPFIRDLENYAIEKGYK